MAPWVPTKNSDISRVIKVLEIPSGGKFLEIWCGDARVSLAVAKAFPDVDIVGVELAFPMFIIAQIRRVIKRQKNASIVLWNAFKQDFSLYDAIYVFWMPDKMAKKIVPKFMGEAKKWAKLYSYVFSISPEYAKNVRSVWQQGDSKIHILEKK